MLYNCELIEQTSQPTLVIHTRTSVENLPQVLGNAYQKIAQYFGETGSQPSGAPFVTYFNMDMQSLDVEIGFPIAKALDGRGDIQPSEIPGGKLARCLYTGPYPEIGPAYESLMQYVAKEGYQTTGISYEFYLNDPTVTPPSELQTQIMFPLKTK